MDIAPCQRLFTTKLCRIFFVTPKIFANEGLDIYDKLVVLNDIHTLKSYSVL